MAGDLGKRLLGEVEEVGVGDILNALRLRDPAAESSPGFGLPPLDRLLRAALEGRPYSIETPPVVELTSLHTGGGATHIIHHLTAIAILPRDVGGKQTCAIIFDVDGHFDVERLVGLLRNLLTAQNTSEDPAANIDDTLFLALRHVHVFRPQSLATLTATLSSLSSYLFDQSRHFSFDRQVGFIAIDSASAFYWQDRAETEDAAFYTKTSGEPAEAAPQSGYVALAAALKSACATLQCPALFTSWHLGPVLATPHSTRAFRPPLPAPFPGLPTLKLACQRVPVKKFPPMISVESAQREATDRLKTVEESKFECFVNEWGVDERSLRRLQNAGGGFEFKILEDGAEF